MYLQDVKRLILKNLHILKTQESLRNTLSNFDEDWKILIECFRNDPATKNSWYLIYSYKIVTILC